MNNSLYGKTLENKRNRCDIKLVNNEEKFLKATSDPRFRTARVFDNGVAGMVLTKCNVDLNAPIAIGAAVLDYAKLIMYLLAYREFPAYETTFDCKFKIIGGDTDSLFFTLTGADLYGQVFQKMMVDGLLDTSNYPRTHPQYSEAHKAELGCFKDEGEGSVYSEFVLLRPKAYSMLAADEPRVNKVKCKGIAKRNVKTYTHDDYREACFTQSIRREVVRNIQATGHVVYTTEREKLALSCVDDKFFWLNDNFCVPYGYHMIPHLLEHGIPNVLPEFERCEPLVRDSIDEVMQEIITGRRRPNSEAVDEAIGCKRLRRC